MGSRQPKLTLMRLLSLLFLQSVRQPGPRVSGTRREMSCPVQEAISGIFPSSRISAVFHSSPKRELISSSAPNSSMHLITPNSPIISSPLAQQDLAERVEHAIHEFSSLD